MYYPNLFAKSVESLDELISKRREIIKENDRILNEKTIDLFKRVDLFFYIYENKKKDLNYKTNGIKSIKFVIHPEYNIKLPLDVIFKKTHATTVSPLIKYNSSIRSERIYRDNMYRLYTENETVDGRKIPFLQKAVVFKLIKLLIKPFFVLFLIPFPGS